MSGQEIEAKFRRLAEPVMGPTLANKVLGRLWHLEEIGSPRDMLALFALDARAQQGGEVS